MTQVLKHPVDSEKYNVVVNEFAEFTEYVVYNEQKIKPRVITDTIFLDAQTGEIATVDINRLRRFKNDNGTLKPIEENSCLISSLQKTLKNSRNRSLDILFGYCLSNQWKYFLTLTFSPKFVDRDNEEDIKYHWKLFRQKLQYIDPNVKLFAIPEPHPSSGKLHFHVFVGDIDLSNFMIKAINPHTGKVIRSHGRIVYNLLLFDFGFSTVVKISGSLLRVSNYLAKYVIKDFGNLGYNKKSFYHTNNLSFKDKKYLLYDNSDLKSLMLDKKSQIYKVNKDFTVYRIFKNFV